MIQKIDTFIGIDPGSNGGFAWWNGGRCRSAKMPNKDDDVTRLKEIQRFLMSIKDQHENPCGFVEFVQAWQSDDDDPGKKYGINKLLKSMTEITTTLTLLEIPFVPVYPVSWQSVCGLRKKIPGETDTDKKNRFKDYAQNCFPEVDVNLATADACCLVQFALVKYHSDPKWIWSKIKNNQPKDLFG